MSDKENPGALLALGAGEDVSHTELGEMQPGTEVAGAELAGDIGTAIGAEACIG